MADPVRTTAPAPARAGNGDTRSADVKSADNAAGIARETDRRTRDRAKEGAVRETDRLSKEHRQPANNAVANPAANNRMNPASGAFVEEEVQGAPVDHPSIENNPREGTSSLQNGGDFNDPFRSHPQDPDFAGQGLDLSVYGR